MLQPSVMLQEPSTLRAKILRRYELIRAPIPPGARRPALRRLLGELGEIAEPLRRIGKPGMDVSPAADPKVVILLPGFGTHPIRMRYMARQLERAGHKVKRWGLGFNLGASEELFAHLSQRVEGVHQRYGKPVTLVGWSLGGVYARELAKLHPEIVSKVVTMGSPFSGSPYDNNAWRIYHLVAGHSVERPPVVVDVAAKPPVETVAIWSPADGIVAPRASRGLPGERDREVSVRCNHVGFPNSYDCIRAVLRELDSAPNL
ncbi:esterase/lipase family protein [Tsuneonella sp. HG222]